jgi:hypothetical protein
MPRDDSLAGELFEGDSRRPTILAPRSISIVMLGWVGNPGDLCRLFPGSGTKENKIRRAGTEPIPPLTVVSRITFGTIPRNAPAGFYRRVLSRQTEEGPVEPALTPFLIWQETRPNSKTLAAVNFL